VKTFNKIALTILKWLRFGFLKWMKHMHHSDLLKNGLGLISIGKHSMRVELESWQSENRNSNLQYGMWFNSTSCTPYNPRCHLSQLFIRP
jgi:hypothetical protein